MKIDLSGEDIETILTSFMYSKQRIDDSEHSPYEIRKENHRKIDVATEKLRKARDILRTKS